MIAVECIEDILDADTARLDAQRPPILTPSGRDFFQRLLREMKGLKLTQVTKELVQETA